MRLNQLKKDQNEVEPSNEPTSEEKDSSKTMKEYSWIEIVKHDRPGDCWVVIHGKVYDLSEFAKIHPGFLIFKNLLKKTPKIINQRSHDL